MTRVPLLLLFLSAFASSCTTSVPTYKSSSQQEYGQIQYVGPSFQASITTAGYVTIGVSAGLGGVAGYLIGREIRIEDSTGAAVDQDLVAALGAVGGLAIGGLVSTGIVLSTGPGDYRLSDDRLNDWTAGLDEHLLITHTVADRRHPDTLTSITGIPISSADTFEFRSVAHAEFFKYYFPDHSELEAKLSRAVPMIPARDIDDLYSLFPTSSSVKDRIRSMIEQCGSVESCVRLSDTYAEFEDMALQRARLHLAKFTEPKTLQRLAEANPEIYEAADSLAAYSARNGGDPVAYLNCFPRGKYRAEFEKSVGSSIKDATTIKELAELAKRLPSVRDEAERKAADIAIAERKYMQYSALFPHGASRSRVEAAQEDEKRLLVIAAENHVRETRKAIRKQGEYHEVNLHPDGKLLRGIWYTDWDADGDDDLFFTFILIGNEVHDGRSPIADRIGAIENRGGRAVFVSDIEANEFYDTGIFKFYIDYVQGSTLYAIGSKMREDDRIMNIEFNGRTFRHDGDRPNDGTREVKTGGVFIIGD